MFKILTENDLKIIELENQLKSEKTRNEELEKAYNEIVEMSNRKSETDLDEATAEDYEEALQRMGVDLNEY